MSAHTHRSVGSTVGSTGASHRAPSEHSWGPPADSACQPHGPGRGRGAQHTDGGRVPPSRTFIDPDVMPPPVPRLAGSSSAASSDGGRARRNSAGSSASLGFRNEQVATTALPHASTSGRRSAESMSEQVVTRSATPTPVASGGVLSESSDRAPLAPAVNRIPDLRRSASSSSVAVLDHRRSVGGTLPPSSGQQQRQQQQQREQQHHQMLQHSQMPGVGSHWALNCNLCSAPSAEPHHNGDAGELQMRRHMFPLEQVPSQHATTVLAMRAAGERAMRSGSVPATVRSACQEFELQQAMHPCPSELTCKTPWDLSDASVAVYPSSALVAPTSLGAAAMPWPPPPLPPIPDELRVRLEALEAQRSAHLRAEGARERQIEKLKAELATAEEQLERCSLDWGTRFAALEASQATAAEGAAEAALRRQHDLELARDRALVEAQRAQTAGDLDRERHAEVQSRHREAHLELEQMRTEVLHLQAERVSDQQLREQAQHRSAELSLDAEGLQSEVRRLREAQHAQEDIASDRQRAWAEVQRLQQAAAERDEARAELGRLHQAKRGHHQAATELRSAHEELQGLRGEITKLQDEAEHLRLEVNRLQGAVDLAETRQYGAEAENRRLHAEVLRLQEEARQATSRSEAHVRQLVTELESEKASGQRRHEALAEQLQECMGGHKQSAAASAEYLQEAQQQIAELRGQLASTEQDRHQVEKSLGATLAQERQAFKDLLDHNRILELEMREVQSRAKLHNDMQQEKHAALREPVVDDMRRSTVLLADQAQYGGSFQIRPAIEPVVRVTTQFSESPASSARSSTAAPPMAADLTDSLDPIPVPRPRRASHQIEVDLTMETSDRNIDVEMVTPGHFFLDKTRAS